MTRFDLPDGGPTGPTGPPVELDHRLLFEHEDYVFGRRRVSDGTMAWLLCNAYPVLDADGQVQQVSVTFTEVTEVTEVRACAAALGGVVAAVGRGLWRRLVHPGDTDLTERKRTEEHIHRLAYYDAWNGLPNRRRHRAVRAAREPRSRTPGSAAVAGCGGRRLREPAGRAAHATAQSCR